MSQFENFELQLAEVEMLTSMYPNPGEFLLHDPTAVVQIRDYLRGLSYDDVTSRIGFTLKSGDGSNQAIELVCNIPHDYPSVKPLLFLNSKTLTRKQHQQLRDDMNIYISGLTEGELCIGNVLEWLIERTPDYTEESSPKSNIPNETNEQFSRLWIYSHHIYSKLKRKSMLDMAPLLRLTGFYMPGKPGMIYVEGLSKHVEEFWSTVRNWNWKRLMIKEKEDISVNSVDIDMLRKFDKFSEECFEPKAGRSREVHMDFGMLYKFLEEHDFKHIFNLYFGVDGQPNTLS